MKKVRAKKRLGQHFLKDTTIATKIVDCLSVPEESDKSVPCLEIGSGMGVLTSILLAKPSFVTYVIEIDNESIEYLKTELPAINDRIIHHDFLLFDIKSFFKEPVRIIGNFPYNISSQILFKVLENRDMVPEVVGMFQKEVAMRIAEKPGSKVYGILSVFIQAFYNVEYLFTVDEDVFHPPPKIKSAVIRLTRNTTQKLNCDEKLFFKVVKTAFNQRRKTLRNSLKSILPDEMRGDAFFQKRPEQLGVDEFVELTEKCENHITDK